jgi:ABC-type transporter Mla subunit MlaD
MKWAKLSLVFSLFYLLSVPLLVYAQDAQPSSQSLSIPGILDNFSQSLNKLEENTNASNQITSGLQMKVNSMQTTIDAQQRQLQQASENSARSEQAAQEKFKNSEATLKSLETSYKTLLRENKEKDGKILKLTETNAAQAKAIAIMGSILGAVLAYLIFRLVLWIKGGAAASLIKKLFRREISL